MEARDSVRLELRDTVMETKTITITKTLMVTPSCRVSYARGSA